MCGIKFGSELRVWTARGYDFAALYTFSRIKEAFHTCCDFNGHYSCSVFVNILRLLRFKPNQ